MTPEQAHRDALEVQARIKAQNAPTYEELVEALRQIRKHAGWCISVQQKSCEAACATADALLARIPA